VYAPRSEPDRPGRRQVEGTAGVSLAATAVFPHAFPAGSTVGSIAVNLLVLYGVVIAGWGADAAPA
jgi:hypothetical protein